MGNEHKVDPRRRRVLHGLLFGSLVGGVMPLVYAVGRYLMPPPQTENSPGEVEAARTDDPDLTAKGFKIVRYGSDPVILFRAPGGDYRAFSATCTHLGCVVAFRSEPQQEITCNCHGGTYDLTGRNVSGPPPRPLRPFSVRVVEAGPREPARILVSRA